MRLAPLLPALAGVTLTGAAPAQPSALEGVEPGLWDVSRSATGANARRQCVRDMLDLASVGHAGERCARRILSDRAGLLVVDLTCPAGDFARMRISVLTPRSLKLESQGIHRGAPFALTLHARRVDDCPRPTAGR